MTNKYMRSCSASLVMTGIQIKTTLSYNFTSTRMVKLKRKEISVKEMKKFKPSYIANRKIKLIQPLWKTIQHFLKLLNIELLYMTQQFDS